MNEIHVNKLQIPVEVSRYVVKNGLEKTFCIFLYLKFHSSGKLRIDSPVFSNIAKDLQIKDNRTFKKHFNKLIELNWIKLNDKADIYFIRGFDRLRAENNFKSKQATTIFYKDLRKFDAYVIGALISAEVVKQKYFWEVVVRRKLRPVANKRDATNPAWLNVYNDPPKYYGVSLIKIATMFGCSKTRASQLRKKAAAAGYIKTVHKFTEITCLPKPDYNVRAQIEQQSPELTGKLRFKKELVNGINFIFVLIQGTDEVIPKIRFKTITKFNNLVVPPSIKKAINLRDSLRAKIAA